MLALLDELCLREIEGRLSADLRDQLDELRLVLLGELDEAHEDFALLPESTPGPAGLQGGSRRRSPQETSGARNPRHHGRQKRRGHQ